MKRRQLLGTTGIAFALGGAGCLGFGSDDDSDGNAGNGGGTTNGNETEAPTESATATETPDDTGGEGDSGLTIDGTWRTFQGDTESTGTGGGSATGPSAEPDEAWTVAAEDELWGDPVIFDGTVLAGSWDGSLYAVSLSSGELLWTYETGGAHSSPVAVVSGTVFVGAGQTVAALDIESGQQYWSRSLDQTVRGGPVVADETLYVPTSGNLTGLSAVTGDTEWTFRTGGPVESPPHVTDESVYFTSNDGNLYAVSPDGEKRWQKFVSSSGGFPSPTVQGGTIYFGWGDGVMYALDTSDGSELWTDKAGGSETVAVSGGTVYLAGYPLKAIDAETQETEWTTEAPEGLPTDFTVGTDRVYLGSDEAKVVAYDRESGEQQWSRQGNYEVTTSVAIADEMLVYGDEFGNIVALG
jgi:outer membrane protein assembly factor BamB